MWSSSSSSNNIMLLRNPLHALQDPSHLRQAFTTLDRDLDGKITFSDLHHFFSISLGKNVKEEDIQSMISVADSDQTGWVGFEEFERIITYFLKQQQKKKSSRQCEADDFILTAVKEMFQMMDRDGDGVVSFGDLKEFINGVMQQRGVSVQELEKMIEAAGGSVKSGIGMGEFVAMITSKIIGTNTK